MQAKVIETPEFAEDALREVSKFGSMVAEAVNDGVDAMKDGLRTASQQYQRTRASAEDMLDDTKRSIKRNPFQAITFGFAAGVLVGGLFGCAVARRRW